MPVLMETAKLSHHSYPTRHRKIAKLDNSDYLCEQRKSVAGIKKAVTSTNVCSKVESPSAASAGKSSNKFCMISGYASPPCRPVISCSQNNEHEIEWDLTSPSARKFQVLVSDKKTSTPNRTPTRGDLAFKRELPRPRLALCKKNIALSSTDENCLDLVNELAALDNLVNTEQANQSHGVMTPPPSVKRVPDNDDHLTVVAQEDDQPQTKPNDNNTSDVFGDDSFFSESILLSTQALEQEAVANDILCDALETPSSTATLNRSPPSATSSPDYANRIRKSFDIDCNTDEPATDSHHSRETGMTVNRNNCSRRANYASSRSPSSASSSSSTQSQLRPLETNLKETQQQAESAPTKCGGAEVFLPPKTVPSRPATVSKACSTPKRSTNSKAPQPIPPLYGNRNHLASESGAVPSRKSVQTACIGVKRLPDDGPAVAPAHPPKTCNNRSPAVGLFDDDEDDDLLYAVAEEVESQYIQKSTGFTNNPELIDDGNDDIFFQPEVLAFISQVESQSQVPKPKSTADLLEEKRQAAIRKREQRMMNRR